MVNNTTSYEDVPVSSTPQYFIDINNIEDSDSDYIDVEPNYRHSRLTTDF